MRQRARKRCSWDIMFTVWRVCAFLSDPSTPLTTLPFTFNGYWAHSFAPTTVQWTENKSELVDRNTHVGGRCREFSQSKRKKGGTFFDRVGRSPDTLYAEVCKLWQIQDFWRQWQFGLCLCNASHGYQRWNVRKLVTTARLHVITLQTTTRQDKIPFLAGHQALTRTFHWPSNHALFPV
jgi:hypothetical protein